MGLIAKIKRGNELEEIKLHKEELLANLDNISDKQLLVEILIELKCLNAEIKSVTRNAITD